MLLVSMGWKHMTSTSIESERNHGLKDITKLIITILIRSSKVSPIYARAADGHY